MGDICRFVSPQWPTILGRHIVTQEIKYKFDRVTHWCTMLSRTADLNCSHPTGFSLCYCVFDNLTEYCLYFVNLVWNWFLLGGGLATKETTPQQRLRDTADRQKPENKWTQMNTRTHQIVQQQKFTHLKNDLLHHNVTVHSRAFLVRHFTEFLLVEGEELRSG